MGCQSLKAEILRDREKQTGKLYQISDMVKTLDFVPKDFNHHNVCHHHVVSTITKCMQSNSEILSFFQ